MVGEHLAVVGGEQHHRVLLQPQLPQRRHDARDAVVDLADQAVVEGVNAALAVGVAVAPSRRERCGHSPDGRSCTGRLAYSGSGMATRSYRSSYGSLGANGGCGAIQEDHRKNCWSLR